MQILKKFIIPISIIIALFGIIVIWNDNDSSVGQYLFLTGVIILAFKIARPFFNRESVLEQWAMKNSLSYFSGNKRQDIFQRLDASPGKSFCNARKILGYSSAQPVEVSLKEAIKQVISRSKPYVISGPYVTGVIENHTIYLYPISGEIFNDSTFSPFKFYGWCMEISANSVPVSVSVSKHFLGQKDDMRTEYNAFEKKYHINVPASAKVLQLLDPNMIEIILKSEIGIVEFSDNSVSLIHTIFPPTIELLDRYLNFGKRIVHQLEHNFPLGKYEKV